MDSREDVFALNVCKDVNAREGSMYRTVRPSVKRDLTTESVSGDRMPTMTSIAFGWSNMKGSRDNKGVVIGFTTIIGKSAAKSVWGLLVLCGNSTSCTGTGNCWSH